jgi:hypothetical protein
MMNESERGQVGELDAQNILPEFCSPTIFLTFRRQAGGRFQNSLLPTLTFWKVIGLSGPLYNALNTTRFF